MDRVNCDLFHNWDHELHSILMETTTPIIPNSSSRFERAILDKYYMNQPIIKCVR